jgi:50S ribosomal protein L16 3-hydroxylase
VAKTLEAIRWTSAEVREFTGRFLSDPKAQVFFTPPRKPLTRRQFAERAGRGGAALDPRSRLLFSGTMFFMNGEAIEVASAARPALRRFADRRALAAPVDAPEAFWDTVHAWYLEGFVQLEEEQP